MRAVRCMLYRPRLRTCLFQGIDFHDYVLVTYVCPISDLEALVGVGMKAVQWKPARSDPVGNRLIPLQLWDKA